jgi:hypothetical protein
MRDKSDRNRLRDVTLAHIAKEMARPLMTDGVWQILGQSAAARCLFHPDDCVYNQNTKEHGLVRRVYEKDGVTTYEVWLPATPGSLQWGHLVSDWTETVLELSDNLLLRSAPGAIRAKRDGRRR